MPTANFTGSEFSLESVSQIAPATIRLTYRQLVLAFNPNGINDGLNIANYTLLGPTVNSISSIQTVYGNPQQVDIFLAAPLTVGSWTITVAANVEMIDHTTLQEARSLSFIVSVAATLDPVSGGATNDTDADVLRKHLNPALVGPGWDAIIAAIATGDKTNRVNAQSAFDQLFTSTASGIYLARHGGDVGLTKPLDIGMSDALYSQFIIKTSTDKVTYQSLLAILEIFYGTGSVRASLTSAAHEPFALQDGDDLTILVDESHSVQTVFTSEDFAIPGSARADEIAAALTRSFELNGTTAYATPLKDPENGLIQLVVYSGSTGLGSSLRVTGGKAQNAIVFPDELTLAAQLPTWTVTRIPGTNNFKFESYQLDSTTDLNLRLLQIGDYVNIFGTEFNPLNRGSFPVNDVFYANDLTGSFIRQSFTITNDFGVAEGPIAQVSSSSVVYFRPTRQSIYNLNQSSAILTQSGDGYVVKLPATSSAVSRTEFTAAYTQTNAPIAITSVARTEGGTVTITAPNHGLIATTGTVQQVIIDGVSFSMSPPAVTPGTGSGNSGTTSSSPLSLVATLEPTVNTGTESQVLLTLPDQTAFMAGGFDYNAGLVTVRNKIDIFTITGITTNADDSRTVSYVWTDAGVVLPVPAAFMGASLGNFNIPSIEDEVVITGGSDCVSSTYFNAYAYDVQGTIRTLTSMTTNRAAHGQTTLNTGPVLVSGGVSDWNRAITSCELYNGSTWSNTGSLNQARSNHNQNVLADGSVLVTGGRAMGLGHLVDTNTVALWRFDSAIGTATDSGPNSLNLTDTSMVLVTGETGKAREFSNTGANMTRPASDSLLNTLFTSESYTIEGWFNNASNSSVGTFLSYSSPSGTSANNVLISLGIAVSGNYYWAWEHGTNVQVYHETSVLASVSATYKWNHYAFVKSPNVTSGLWDVSLYINGLLIQTWLANVACDGGASSKLYFGTDRSGSIGGSFSGGAVDDTKISTVSLAPAQVWIDYQTATGELLPADNTRYGLPLNSCERYASGVWSIVGQMGLARFGHASILLPNGQLIVIGGLGYNATQISTSTVPAPVRAIELFDPVTNRWRTAANTLNSHGITWAQYIVDRNEIIFGSSESSSVERLDLDTFLLNNVATIATPANGAKSTLLSNDLILIAGGRLGSSSTNVDELYIANADSFAEGGLNGFFEVNSVLDVNTFTINTPDYPTFTSNGSSSATVTLVAAAVGAIAGPYIYDPNAGVAITGTLSTLVGNLAAGRQYGSITLADASPFPDAPGYLVFDFGFKDQVGPVKYFGKLSDVQLVLDDSFVFPNSISSGSTVTYLTGKAPYVPANPEKYGSFYLTDSPSGRIGAENALDSNTAAGVDVTQTVIYPSDRGMGGEGYPASGQKISDKVVVWGSSDLDTDVAEAEGRS